MRFRVHYFARLLFFWRIPPRPTFCVPSQFVSWSAHPLEPPSETYVSALHDIWSTKARRNFCYQDHAATQDYHSV